MRAIDKKLWRELWGMRLQALAIAMVIVSGVGIFIMSLSTLDSRYQTREAYYRNYHFAHVFSSLKRAPLSSFVLKVGTWVGQALGASYLHAIQVTINTSCNAMIEIKLLWNMSSPFDNL